MLFERRRFLQAMGYSSAGLMLPVITIAQTGANPQNTLKIPALLSGDLRAEKKHYSLIASAGNSNFLLGLTTPTLGLNGSYLGPTLRFARDDQIAMHVQNSLGEDTTIHWHGLHVPAKADGGPGQIITAGGSWHPEFTVMQKAGTFWYHSHMLGKTGEQVYRGLAGMIIIDDDESRQLGLPSDYGVDDIPLIVQDRRFNADGSFAYVSSQMDIMTGMFGDTILVNGTVAPVFAPSTSKVRFRLLNAANARTFTFAFADGRQFQQVASDGGLLSASLDLVQLELAPAERAEIVVDFSDGQPTSLLSLPMDDNSPFAEQGMMRNMHPMNTETFIILELQPQSRLQTSASFPAMLTSIRRMAESEAVRTRHFTLSMIMGMGMGMAMRGGSGGAGQANQGGGSGMMMMGEGNNPFRINDQVMRMDVINERVPMGDTEIWEIYNDSMMMHPFHIHHSQFQILDRNGVPPAPSEMGFKDTVKVGPGETVRFIMHFENFLDPDTSYMYHCHILEHEDNGMMGQFVVS